MVEEINLEMIDKFFLSPVKEREQTWSSWL